jgi:hypothetical protein
MVCFIYTFANEKVVKKANEPASGGKRIRLDIPAQIREGKSGA